MYGTKKVDLGGKGSFDVKKGALHHMLNIPTDQTIPPARLKAAQHSDNPRERKRANSAAGFKAMGK